MLDLFDEFKALIARLSERGVDYALCDGLAMAVYGVPRATVDIDLLILVDDLEKAMNLAREEGYTIKAKPMILGEQGIEIRRISKVDPDSGDLLMLDLLLVTPPITHVWESRKEVEWENGKLKVVSRDGLIALKSLRGSGQDIDDIEKLREGADEG